jgi:hypothetical protein
MVRVLMSVGVMTVGVMSVGEMRRPPCFDANVVVFQHIKPSSILIPLPFSTFSFTTSINHLISGLN